MDSLSSSNRESYCRVQNQISCEETDEPVEEASVTNFKCKYSNLENNNKVLWRWIKVLAAVSILATILSAAAVTMATLHWMMAGDMKTANVQQCMCPAFTESDMREVVLGDSTDIYPDQVTTVGEILEHCPDCRIRRDGSRSSLLQPGQGRTRNHRRCNRACRVELDELRLSVKSQESTAIHFHGFPPGLYELGQDGAYKWWRPSAWYSQMHGFFYNHTSGHVVTMEKGLYFIYSQVEHPANQDQAHVIMVNNTVFLRCVKSVPTTADGRVAVHDQSSCYIGGAIVLDQYEQIWIKGTHTRTHVQVKESSSYWGIVKLRGL